MSPSISKSADMRRAEATALYIVPPPAQIATEPRAGSSIVSEQAVQPKPRLHRR